MTKNKENPGKKKQENTQNEQEIKDRSENDNERESPAKLVGLHMTLLELIIDGTEGSHFAWVTSRGGFLEGKEN